MIVAIVISFSGYAYAGKDSKPPTAGHGQTESDDPASDHRNNGNNDNNGRNEGPFITGVINADGTPNNIPEENPAQNSPN